MTTLAYDAKTRARHVRRAERFLKLYRKRQLTDPEDIKHALSLKWFRLCALYYIKDKNGRRRKFRPNAMQRKRFIDMHVRDLILKARQLGMTTFEMIDALDDCLFTENFSAGCIAHTVKDAKSIFRDKIRFAYENVPAGWVRIIRKLGYHWPLPTSEPADSYVFDNGSTIGVSTSFRGGVLQRLHVSEFGKICKKNPDKAEEIVTGAFEAVGIGNKLTIESTAEGREGYFYTFATEALKLHQEGRRPNIMQWQFHFFAWYEDPAYVMDPSKVAVPQWMREYFEDLESKYGIVTTPEQQAWYAEKAAIQGDKMKREYPATPEEAFEQSLEGAYYARQMADMRTQRRLTSTVEHNPALPVYTAWDLGMNDQMAIWFAQIVGRQVHLIDYLEDSGEGLSYYARRLTEKGYHYAGHFGPHDLAVRELGGDGKSRQQAARELGINFTIVPRVKTLQDGIEAVRRFLPMCWIDPESCDDGVKALDAYRKEWDEKLGAYKDRPRHDWASHGAKAFETLARARLFEFATRHDPTNSQQHVTATTAGGGWGGHT